MRGPIFIATVLLAGLGIGLMLDIFAPSLGIASSSTPNGPALDYGSYMTGLVVGALAATIAGLPWETLPTRMHRFIVSKRHIYNFAIVAAACLGILLYF